MSQNRLKVCPYCQRTVAGKCEECNQTTKEVAAIKDRARGSAASRGYDHKWRKARVIFLKKHPWCQGCLRHGRRTLANIVDHIVPHRGDKKLFWDKENWQPLCKKCHDAKTARGK